ncbi:conserved hypothetical protein [Verticillium alfalfae VaMs.102]|uniref:DNA replication regulator Sld3 C-terminal domain-containing protein n=1 Tax=Verticillium alfalfae (strain VaMs.102 / ATCC MYA-4576 / FGSC 10136) TaxID=526221 RepID=C9SJG6_VERA1|nr:conserved hypothetical protein [Verticillium alfalfae VaMs.102]EEY18328.1 conserved hypothetical protein [Verticillium alfalfae VaMs.102]
MSSSRPVAPPTDVSRPGSGILTPSSDSLLNHDAAFGEVSKTAGRRGSSALEHLLKSYIVVKVGSPLNNRTYETQSDNPRAVSSQCCGQTFHSAAVDAHSPRGAVSFPPRPLFAQWGSSLKPTLRIPHQDPSILKDRMADRPSLLIARNESSKTLYAVERADKNLFTVCKLGSWVNIQELAAKATVASQTIAKSRPSPQGPQAVPLTTPQLHKEQKEKKLAIEALQSIVRKRARSQSTVTVEETGRAEKRIRSDDDASRPPTPLSQTVVGEKKTAGLAHVFETAPALAPALMEDVMASPTAENMYNNIRAQYLEVLYKSKGSLAYFAKGPLSRARAAFHMDCDGNLSMDDLIEYLTSQIMTTVQLDKKYRETIPDIISKMKTHVESSDDGSKSKKRKPKKMKLGKDGLYPTEDSVVRTWWTANRPEIADEDASITPAQIRSHVDLLRTRETQLQMILILEILSLEPLRPKENEEESQLPGLAPTENKDGSASQPMKKRNKHKLPVLVDVHADRLCIWQSTASDELRLLEDTQVVTQADGTKLGQKASADPLKDFCTDIIMQFFAARLPELCDGINRKLGGPVIIPTPKPKQTKPSSSSKPKSKTNVVAKRSISASKASKSIQEELAKEQSRRSVSRGPGSAIALMRSATSSTLPALKRESSDQSLLSGMAKAEPGSLSERSRVLSRSSSMTALGDVKAQKKAIVDAELRNAISMLRKPNREMANLDVVEAAERRTSGGLSHTRKTKKPVRHPLFQSVQVKATPANNRFRDALAEAGGSAKMPAIFMPPSSASMIPSTAKRRSTSDYFGSFSSSAVKATPSRPRASAPLGAPHDEPSIPPSSPLMARVPATTPAQPRPRAMRSPSPIGAHIFDTPVKAATSFSLPEDEIAATPVMKTAAPAEKKASSIYEKLGWDDDFDDLL